MHGGGGGGGGSRGRGSGRVLQGRRRHHASTYVRQGQDGVLDACGTTTLTCLAPSELRDLALDGLVQGLD